MTLAAIVPTRNEEKLIGKTLAHLKAVLPKNAHIIVADGKSSDRTVKIAKKYGSVVFASRNKKHKHQNIASGRNEGAAHAKAEILLFCDADTLPQKQFIAHAMELFKKDPEVVSVGCQIRPDVNDWNTQLFFSFLNAIVRAATLLGKPVIAGNCVLYRKKAFDKVGGFDESMAASEDQDLSMRIAKTGRVVLLTQYTAKTSNRRLQQEGWIGLLKDWGGTTINFILGKKTTQYGSFR